KPQPINYYGRTKLAAENALRISGAIYTILRTNVLYGIIPNGRLDFVRWVVETVRAGKPIKIVTDQLNNPTFIDDLVSGINLVIENNKTGILHIGGMDVISRFEFTMKIADVFNLDKSLISPILTYELKQPANRPLKSGLLILKAQSELGYSPTDLTQSLLEMKEELYS
ncbi:MAG: sugar nucleotide-binding protein, partial [Ignavibacteriales bacterium]|nr:sugar nucleotide-binding protein [Ignavibacteriales bacterium]